MNGFIDEKIVHGQIVGLKSHTLQLNGTSNHVSQHTWVGCALHQATSSFDQFCEPRLCQCHHLSHAVFLQMRDMVKISNFNLHVPWRSHKDSCCSLKPCRATLEFHTPMTKSFSCLVVGSKYPTISCLELAAMWCYQDLITGF